MPPIYNPPSGTNVFASFMEVQGIDRVTKHLEYCVEQYNDPENRVCFPSFILAIYRQSPCPLLLGRACYYDRRSES
jgi:hypothetical protein